MRNLKEDQARFLWLYQCHNFMINLRDDDNKKAKEEMIAYCRQEFKDNKSKSAIDHFNKESFDDNAKNALWWYSQNTFIYKCTNTVLRKENISHVYSHRYIIKLLCRQLTELHEKFVHEYKKSEKETSLHLYRGAYWRLCDIQLLQNNINDLISLNGFVSASRLEGIAIDFIRNRRKEGCETVLIKIDIDMTNKHSVAFADISKFSQSPGEEEVLLSIGSVFRVETVDFDDKEQFHVIHLSLSRNDQLTVIKYIEHTYAKNVDTADQSVLFGKLLFDMGECEAAATYFRDALERLTDNNNEIRATYLNNLGVCYDGMGKKDEALKYYKGALRFYEQAKNERGIGACQHNVSISSGCFFVLYFLILFYYR
jgi:tetratricopeptide (TPR) repeat protein